MPGEALGRSRSASTAWRRRVARVALPAIALVAVSCGATDDGRTLRPPTPDQTTTTVASTTPGVDAGSAGDEETTAPTEPLRLSSPAFDEGGVIPADHTCRGSDVSPPLRWTGVPAGTVELAVIVRDIDADGFVHWVVAGIDPTTGGLAEGTLPPGAVEATNDFGRAGWSGPCPPQGTHYYDVRVYALSEPSGITAGQAGADATGRIEAAPALLSAALSGSAGAGASAD